MTTEAQRTNGKGSSRNGNGKRAPAPTSNAAELRQLRDALRAMQEGDFTVRLATRGEKGIMREIAEAYNGVVALNDRLSNEVVRVERVVGREGEMTERVSLGTGSAGWLTIVRSINALIGDLVQPTTEVARVISAVAAGDLTRKMALEIEGQPVKGEFLRIGTTVNSMVDQLSSFSAEVTRVAKEVGTDGKLGGQAEVPAAAGIWRDLTDNVNRLANNLTAQVRNIAEVTTSVAKGDLSKKITVDAKGEVLELKNTINTMVDQLNSFAAEVTRVAKEVGTDGKLGGQADVRGVSGVWKDLTNNVNLMATNLTTQVRGIVKVVTAVANGDLTQRLVVDAKGEVAALADTLNSMTKTLEIFAEQVTSVAKTVGVEGKLGAQAEVPKATGTWKDLTDNVNLLANNLTAQVRNIAEVTTAVAKGDLSKKITVDAKGEVLELKNTINTMVVQLNSFAAEVTRVAREVGTEGKLGGQADVRGVSGVWKDLTDNVNFMASTLTGQVRNIALVTTAVAKGDLSRKITVDMKGEILELKNTINTMVDQLNAFAAEVTRVAKEVGTEGKLGAQAEVHGVAGTWKDLTDNVNLLANNLTAQVRNIAEVSTAVANGDLSRKITVSAKGEVLELKNTINTMVDQLNSFAAEVARVAKDVGTEGKLGGQADVRGVSGVWKNLTDNVNLMASNLTTQVRGIVRVVTAVASGDLTQKLVVDAKGEVAALADTLSSMTKTLGIFAEQVTSVAKTVGVEGKLGAQAEVPDVAGTWKDLTDNVNLLANNLTAQVRNVAEVSTAVAKGDLSKKITVDARGEVLDLKNTINTMVDQLNSFAAEVTRVAKEVGTDGKLGGQADVKGASGVWEDLTDNVNVLAGNLTTQVRAISEVATAVTTGDLTRSITVEARGEVASLKDNINQMIVNLKETTQKNTEQDWLKTNLAKFSNMMQGQKDLEAVSRLIMSELTPLVSAHHGAFFIVDFESRTTTLKLSSSYAYRERKNVPNRFRPGEGLVGQCALEKKTILLTKVPSDYIQINSGLGEATPLNIIVVPVLFEGEVKAVMELASFSPFSAIHQIFLDQLTESIGVVLNMISANMRTEQLLQQSQGLTMELQNQSKELTLQQEELRHSNSALEKQALELEEKARLLEEQNRNVEVKNREVEQARASLEEKAAQLALISKYKSEFLANMSHELRTPLTSVLILAKLLSENRDGHLVSKEIDYAKTIHAAGGDLLELINQILDSSKVESGKMRVDPREMELADVQDFVARNFAPVADEKGLSFEVHLAPDLPASVCTDAQRLEQVLKNLLANAFKFTDAGQVQLRITRADRQTRFDAESLDRADEVVAFSVIDTGIGIPDEKQRLIFEAFQQADGTTSRKYGGTGLGLSISREIAKLLGGEIHVSSKVGKGSTFTLYLPRDYRGVDPGTIPNETESLPAGFPTPSGGRNGTSSSVLESRSDTDNGTSRAVTSLANCRVLVIDDDVRNIFAIASVLERHDVEVIQAESAKSGLAVLDAQPAIDVVLMDIMMPGMDGYEAMRTIRRDPRFATLPIVAITAKALSDDREKCMAAGASDYLPKPLSADDLVDTLRRWVQP